jgi:hypothetical protein
MTRYPIIGLAATKELVPLLLNGSRMPAHLDDRTTFVGEDDHPLLELSPLELLSDDVARLLTESGTDEGATLDRDAVEGQLAIKVYQALDPARVPLEALDDPGFWRFVGLRHLWRFIVWREPALIPGAEWSKVARYVDGTKASECVALRMFVRASICHEAGSLELSDAVERGTDFWRSHLVRVGTGAVPPLAAAFIKAQANDHLAADPVRAVAKRLNRTRANVLMFHYDSGEAEELVRELW